MYFFSVNFLFTKIHQNDVQTPVGSKQNLAEKYLPKIIEGSKDVLGTVHLLFCLKLYFVQH